MGFFDWLRGKLPAPAPQQRDPKSLFLDEMERRLRAIDTVTGIARDDGDFSLEVDVAGSQGTLNMSNLFAETRDVSPEERDRLMGRFVAGMVQAMSREERSWDEVKDHLVPVLRASMGKVPQQLACCEVVPCLNLHLVVDDPDAMAYVKLGDLERWGVTFEQALDVARAMLAPDADKGISLYDEALRIWDVGPDDDYDPSRLLLPGFLSSFEGKVNGRPIAIAPARNMLLVAGDANPDTVIRLCEMAEREYGASSRPISAAVYTYAADAVLVPYVRAQDDAAARRVKENHVRFKGTEYARQRHDLEREYEAEGVDRFVASFSGLDHEEHGLVSWCSWAFDVDGLLPVTDLVAVDLRGAMTLVPFADALAIAGDCLERAEGLFPVRYRTVKTPSDAQLERLKAAEAFKGG